MTLPATPPVPPVSDEAPPVVSPAVLETPLLSLDTASVTLESGELPPELPTAPAVLSVPLESGSVPPVPSVPLVVGLAVYSPISGTFFVFNLLAFSLAETLSLV